MHRLIEDDFRSSLQNGDALTNLPTAPTIKQVRGLCGLVNYYCRFIKDVASFLKPIYEFQSHHIVKWTEQCHQDFDKIKQILTSLPSA